MFETQSNDEWLPAWLRRWKPFFLCLLLTPFALLVGLSDFGPEGPQIYVGFFIFPYAAVMYFATMVTGNEFLFFVSIILALLQFPIYGLILSGFKKVSYATILLILVHVITGLLMLAALLSIRFLRCGFGSC